ncbi:MAG TPA: alpha-amylase [Ruminococcaceae bacterium]|nr:alpha-amylase [Oscillospiraceae bacterium]
MLKMQKVPKKFRVKLLLILTVIICMVLVSYGLYRIKNTSSIYELGRAEQKASGNRQGVYYEIFVRAFADSDGDGIGDIKGLTSKLDYLNDRNPKTTSDLGITGIWLMPINETVSYHGYDITNYYDINPEYGTMDDFERFLEEAHKRGISVIMDLVLNHTSDKHEWFISSTDPQSPYRDWYLWADEGTKNYNLKANVWGHPVWNKINDSYYFGLFWSGMPDLNFNNEKVRQEAKNIAGFWLDKGVDGFRLDAVPHLFDTTEVPFGESGFKKTVAWWSEFKEYCHNKKPGCIIVGEVLNDNSGTRASYLPALDSTFHIGLGNQITTAIKAGVSKNNFLNNFITNNYKKYSEANPDYVDAPMLSNHDQNRIIGSVTGKHELMKVAASIYLTLEGIPFIYYGEEIGMFGGKPDEDIRLPYVWGEDEPAQTSWRQSKYKEAVTPVLEQEKDNSSLLTHYKRIIRVRNENEALYAGKFSGVSLDNDSILAYKMESENQSALVFHNLSQELQDIEIDVNGYTLKFCQTKEGFAVKGESISIPPLSTVIYVKDF